MTVISVGRAKHSHELTPSSGNGSKVVYVGFQKTGSTSFGMFFDRLGLRTCGFRPDFARPNEDLNTQEILKFAEKYDAFQDNPWSILYKELDLQFPGSKFILNIRDSEGWYESCVKEFGETTIPMRVHIYGIGSPINNKETFVKRYEKHNNDVLDYFKDRSDDFLQVDLFGDSSQSVSRQIKEFLGKTGPSYEGVGIGHYNKHRDLPYYEVYRW